MLPILSMYEGKGQQGEQRKGGVSLYPSLILASVKFHWVLVRTERGCTWLPGIWESPRLCLMQRFQAAFQGSHQDTEATLMSCLIILADMQMIRKQVPKLAKLGTEPNEI